jgi:glucose/arabinose dehydrogenase
MSLVAVMVTLHIQLETAVMMSSSHPFPRFTAAMIMLLILAADACLPAAPAAGVHQDRIRMPNGFHISLYADGVPGARSMAMSPRGVLFMGTLDEGRVYALVDVITSPDGGLLVSDGRAGVIYRITTTP